MMNKRKLLLFIPVGFVLYVLFSWVYINYFTFSVLPGREAIVTKSGAVVGEPRKFGVHKINPFTEVAHHVDMKRVRIWNQKLVQGESYSLIVF